MNISSRIPLETLAVLLLVLLTCTFSIPAFAIERSPMKVECSEHRSPERFVRDAVAFCLPKGNVNCDRQAKRYFKGCGFEGNFEEMSAEVTRKLVLMLVLNRAPANIPASEATY